MVFFFSFSTLPCHQGEEISISTCVSRDPLPVPFKHDTGHLGRISLTGLPLIFSEVYDRFDYIKIRAIAQEGAYRFRTPEADTTITRKSFPSPRPVFAGRRERLRLHSFSRRRGCTSTRIPLAHPRYRRTRALNALVNRPSAPYGWRSNSLRSPARLPLLPPPHAFVPRGRGG